MKKALIVLVSLCAVLALSCGTSGGGSAAPSPAPAATAAPTTGNLGAFRLILADNFQYGTSYQGVLTNRNLLGGYQIKAGETWNLTMKLTASRDLEDKLMVGFVDTTEAANWWTQLTWSDEQKVEPASVPAFKAGEEITATFTLKTIAGATSASTAANALVFLTDGEGVRGRAGSGVKKNVTLSFTEFVLTKVE